MQDLLDELTILVIDAYSLRFLIAREMEVTEARAWQPQARPRYALAG